MAFAVASWPSFFYDGSFGPHRLEMSPARAAAADLLPSLCPRRRAPRRRVIPAVQRAAGCACHLPLAETARPPFRRSVAHLGALRRPLIKGSRRSRWTVRLPSVSFCIESVYSKLPRMLRNAQDHCVRHPNEKQHSQNSSDCLFCSGQRSPKRYKTKRFRKRS